VPGFSSSRPPDLADRKREGRHLALPSAPPPSLLPPGHLPSLPSASPTGVPGISSSRRKRMRVSRMRVSHDEEADLLKRMSEVTSLLSFNLWGGGVMPLSEEYSAACYVRTVGEYDSSILPSLPKHPNDCLCNKREYVLVGGFHIVQVRQPYTTPTSSGGALVAGFHSIHSIGPQLVISSPQSQPVSVYNVQLAVRFSQVLQQSGVRRTESGPPLPWTRSTCHSCYSSFGPAVCQVISWVLRLEGSYSPMKMTSKPSCNAQDCKQTSYSTTRSILLEEQPDARGTVKHVSAEPI